ncbi:MAG: ferredoxin [Desulfuromonadales bacterium]
MPKKPWVDQEVCISCGLCISNIPDVFRFAENGKAECYDPNRWSHGADRFTTHGSTRRLK